MTKGRGLDSRVNYYNDKGIGRFKVLCRGGAILPSQWYNSLCSWFLIIVPSGVQIYYINTAYDYHIII